MKVFITSFLFSIGSLTVVAQSNIKEGNNSFALYTKTAELKHLESARKFADAAFTTKKDSAGVNNNLLRGLVYSSLAVADSSRKQKYSKDPIDVSLAALAILNKKEVIRNYPTESAYIKRNIANALIFKANAALLKEKYQDAFNHFKQVDSLGIKNTEITYNLAVLATKSKMYAEAIPYYVEVLESPKSTAEQALELANIYLLQNNKAAALDVLEKAKSQFPLHKGILFQLTEIYTSQGAFAKVTNIIEDALRTEPNNVRLHYLAGYAFENERNIPKAIQYYEQVMKLDKNNYEANLALGLIYLDEFLKDKSNDSLRDLSQTYLLKSNEINPVDVNTLKSLAIFYRETDDFFQLDRVNILLNQLSNN